MHPIIETLFPEYEPVDKNKLFQLQNWQTKLIDTVRSLFPLEKTNKDIISNFYHIVILQHLLAENEKAQTATVYINCLELERKVEIFINKLKNIC